MTKLLQGFYQPTSGQLRLDGHDIGVVPQETVLFSGTIYENLQMANPHATFEQAVSACKMAEIHEVIEGLPKGCQSEIGERGTGRSGGQKQRLAIARALLKQPKILVFVEAASSLDKQTAEHFALTINISRAKRQSCSSPMRFPMRSMSTRSSISLEES